MSIRTSYKITWVWIIYQLDIVSYLIACPVKIHASGGTQSWERGTYLTIGGNDFQSTVSPPPLRETLYNGNIYCILYIKYRILCAISYHFLYEIHISYILYRKSYIKYQILFIILYIIYHVLYIIHYNSYIKYRIWFLINDRSYI